MKQAPQLTDIAVKQYEKFLIDSLSEAITRELATKVLALRYAERAYSDDLRELLRGSVTTAGLLIRDILELATSHGFEKDLKFYCQENVYNDTTDGDDNMVAVMIKRWNVALKHYSELVLVARHVGDVTSEPVLMRFVEEAAQTLDEFAKLLDKVREPLTERMKDKHERGA